MKISKVKIGYCEDQIRKSRQFRREVSNMSVFTPSAFPCFLTALKEHSAGWLMTNVWKSMKLRAFS